MVNVQLGSLTGLDVCWHQKTQKSRTSQSGHSYTKTVKITKSKGSCSGGRKFYLPVITKVVELFFGGPSGRAISFRSQANPITTSDMKCRNIETGEREVGSCFRNIFHAAEFFSRAGTRWIMHHRY